MPRTMCTEIALSWEISKKSGIRLTTIISTIYIPPQCDCGDPSLAIRMAA
jgi:hypothetical protein